LTGYTNDYVKADFTSRAYPIFPFNGGSRAKSTSEPPHYREEAVDMVMSLPEVGKSDAYIHRHTKGKRKLFAMTYGEPSKDRQYYCPSCEAQLILKKSGKTGTI
jgi:hypothetical protein